MKRGFSLVELSVVLVVIGLLIGGIIAGKSLITGGELKDIQKQALTTQAAFVAFRDQYGYYPGDYPKAESVWGTDPGGCPNNTVTTGHSTTCNGNGDGKITAITESFHAWQQLADAGLITGSYVSGFLCPGTNGIYPGCNTLATKRKNVGVDVIYWSGANLEGNLMAIGAATPGGSTLVFGGLTPTEAYATDTKFDDGLPFSGKVQAQLYYAANPNCANSTNTTYNLANGEVLNIGVMSPTGGCQLWWKWD